LLRKQSKDRSVRVTLVSRDNYFLMTPLLFEAGSGVLEPRHTVNPIRPLLKSTRFVEARSSAWTSTAASSMAATRAGFDPVRAAVRSLVFALGGITNRAIIPAPSWPSRSRRWRTASFSAIT
jgi:NADH dehydrogenase